MRLSLRGFAATIVNACLLLSFTDASSTQRNPLNTVSIVDEPIIHTPSHRANSYSSFDLTFHLHEKKQFIKLTLTPNHDIIAEDASIQILAPDGSVKSTEFIERSDHKIFKGQAWIQKHRDAEWTNIGWARVMILHDGDSPLFEGAFLFEGNHHHIVTRSKYAKTKDPRDPDVPAREKDFMIMFRDSDIKGNDHIELKSRTPVEQSSCLSDDLSFNMQPDHPIYSMKRAAEPESTFWGVSPRAIFGRQIDGTTTGNSGGVNLVSTIGNSTGCFSTRRVALVGIATDCTYTAAFNSTASVRAHIIQQIALASAQYESSFNITLGIRNLTIFDAACPASASASAPWNAACSTSVQIQDRLNLFSAWRGTRNDTNAYWTLLTTCPSGSAVGLAWLGQACLNTASVNVNETVSSANVVVKTPLTEWQIIAHETGHTFGAVHDCTSTTCNDGVTVNAQQCCPLSSTVCDAGQKYLMNPSTGSTITQFSPCSIGNICSAIGKSSVKTNCLTANKDVQTITGSQCGNGIVEAGEDCDCGGTSGCGSNSCCNPTTCKFTTGSVCDPSNEDCCSMTCQFAGSGTVCRASTGVCDPQEVCSGTAALCPTDVSAPDGTTCGNSTLGLSCTSGQCTSRNAQCQTLMGSLAHDKTTYACDDSSCQVLCASPAFGSTCYSMQQYFLDGTSCAGGGRCKNGQCTGGSVGAEVTSWINANKTLVIGLAAGIGGFLVLLILCCCVSSWRKRKNARKLPPSPPPGWRGPGMRVHYNSPPVQQWQGQPIPTPPRMRNNGRWEAPPLYSTPTVRYA